ncbi:hypothetical protein DPMN_066282 [Dreissena polymorpha]|uniref:Uncharacterized protein n=1 Tax=Dreissena polymorpha TaxID=45954 RepID=A0A9D4BKC4_DREPO|nr:hypothetical protein DPMN_066282 [Dreissena polymorpha]
MRIQIITFSPFTADPTQINIVNGKVAGPYVNVHAFEAAVNENIRYIIVKLDVTYKCKRKDKAKFLRNSSAVMIASDHATDSAFQFNRFLSVSVSGDLFHECRMNPNPPVLFEANTMLYKSYKTKIIKAMRDHAAGCLLDRSPWKKSD